MKLSKQVLIARAKRNATGDRRAAHARDRLQGIQQGAIELRRLEMSGYFAVGGASWKLITPSGLKPRCTRCRFARVPPDNSERPRVEVILPDEPQGSMG